jgi:TRAP-type mannitol/chloroaromatic compound transport system substrate-binding protein
MLQHWRGLRIVSGLWTAPALDFLGLSNASPSAELMDAARKASFELHEEESAKNPACKKQYEPRLKFRDDINLWHRVAEQSYTTFVAANPPPTKK